MKSRNAELSSSDVHQLVEQLSHLLQKAIVLENEQFELIAYSAPSEYSFDSIQQKTILTKRCPLYVIEHLKKEGIIQRLQAHSQPIRVHLLEEEQFYQRIAISIQQAGRILGYLWIYDQDEILDDKEARLIVQSAHQIGQVLYEEHLMTQEDPPSFLWKLVNGDYSNEFEIAEAARSANYAFSSHFSVLVLSVKAASDLYLLEKVKASFTDLKLVYYLGKGTEIIGLVDRSSDQEVQTFLKRLVDSLFVHWSNEERSRILLGIGESYDEIKKVRKSYLEALEVIEMMSFLNLPEQTVFFYHQLGFFRHVKEMYKKNITEQYRNEQILRLMEKDRRSNSELLKTVWFYVKYDCKLSRAAEALFIHQNTLHYRLKLVDEISSLDFNNMLEKIELYIELLLIFHVEDYRLHYEAVLK